MLITMAGAQYLLRTGNGLSSLQLGIDGRFFFWPKLAHHSVELLIVRHPMGLSRNSIHCSPNSGNENPRRTNDIIIILFNNFIILIDIVYGKWWNSFTQMILSKEPLCPWKSLKTISNHFGSHMTCSLHYLCRH
jgi:hypothetical protein